MHTNLIQKPLNVKEKPFTCTYKCIYLYLYRYVYLHVYLYINRYMCVYKSKKGGVKPGKKSAWNEVKKWINLLLKLLVLMHCLLQWPAVM